MNCHDIQLLLAFVDRKTEELDETERAIVQQHLNQCPACAEAAQADRRVDETFGALMRDVAVPAGLKQKVLGKLDHPRAGLPWKSGLALAAAIAIALSAWLYFAEQTRPAVTLEDIAFYAIDGNLEADAAERELANRGVTVKVPRTLFDYAYLQNIDVIEFKGRRVAKLTFSRVESSQPATASVLILSREQFNLKELSAGHQPVNSRVLVHDEDGFASLVFYRGDLAHLALQRPGQ